MNQQGIIKLLLTCSSDFKKLYDKIITELSSAVSVSAKDASTDEFYNIERDCTPSEKTKVQALLSQYSNALQGLIQQGITHAVLLCADTQNKALKSYTRMEGDEVDAWRKDTAKAFTESRMKRDKGLNLSDRVWNYTQQTKSEFELAMSHALEDGISKGTSAEDLGRKVRQYLNNPDMMYRRYHTKKLMSDGTKKDVVEWRKRVIDEDGKVHFVKDDLAKVGTGVYRSARQNALRLTITETNMAYDYANCTRWANEPFVLGLRIRLSDAHPEDDICNELEGDYPKTFLWRGWHPRCMCSISPILMDRKSEEWKKLRAMSDEDYKKYQSPNLIKNVPKEFKQWCDTNNDKLNAAREKGKLPYFVRDNEKVVGEIVGWEEEKTTSKNALSSREKILAAAKARHEARTEEQIADIKKGWKERQERISRIIPHESIEDLKNRLGTSTPKTLDNLEEAIKKYEKTPYYGDIAKNHKQEIEQLMTKLFNEHDLGMNIEDTTLDSVLNSWFKNTFETGTSGGYLGSSSTSGKIDKKHMRLEASHHLFGLSKDLENGQLDRHDYEKYGNLLDHDILRSMKNNTASLYGNVEVRFKKNKVVATWTAGDSLDEEFQPSLVSDPKSCSFDALPYTPNSDKIQVANLTEFKDNYIEDYLELQYHGNLTIDCVDSLTFPYDLKDSNNLRFLKVAERWKNKGAKIYYTSKNKLYQL